MRAIAGALVLAISLVAPAALARTAPSAKDAALHDGDWRSAAEAGASAAEVVRALQARGRFADRVPARSVVTIRADNSVDVVALEPLPSLERAGVAGKDMRTVGLSGSGFTFANPDAIVLYPDYAGTYFQAGAPGPVQ